MNNHQNCWHIVSSPSPTNLTATIRFITRQYITITQHFIWFFFFSMLSVEPTEEKCENEIPNFYLFIQRFQHLFNNIPVGKIKKCHVYFVCIRVFLLLLLLLWVLRIANNLSCKHFIEDKTFIFFSFIFLAATIL